MQNLDDVELIKKLDPSNVLGSIGLFPDQCEQAWTEAKAVQFPQEYKNIQNIVVCGMGGSRFTPRTIKELFQGKISVPYEIIDGYDVPGYVTENSLVILSSYSGTTEEVMSCAAQALSKKAKICGLAMGGDVIEFLKKNNFPYYQFNPTNNPCGQPRVGGGYLLMGHLAFLVTLGFLPNLDADVSHAVAWAKKIGTRMQADIATDQNPAKELAVFLKDKHPILIAAEFLRGFVNGFANQINETAKMISDYRYIPELNHHMLEGLTHPETLHLNAVFVFLDSTLYSNKIQKRFAITKEVVEKQNVQVKALIFQGKDQISQVCEAYVLSGYTTFYLAMLYDTDPVAIPWVDYFKKKLKE